MRRIVAADHQLGLALQVALSRADLRWRGWQRPLRRWRRRGSGGAAERVPVARDAASTAELECVLQQRLVAAHPSAPHELREHLLRLEEQAT